MLYPTLVWQPKTITREHVNKREAKWECHGRGRETVEHGEEPYGGGARWGRASEGSNALFVFLVFAVYLALFSSWPSSCGAFLLNGDAVQDLVLYAFIPRMGRVEGGGYDLHAVHARISAKCLHEENPL